MRILRAAQHRVMPWKNGLGSTSEIAVWPEGAGLDEFDWRVSMATVRADGPFSEFAGIDRTLTVLDGAGIRLRLGGEPSVELTTRSAPFWFPGDVPTLGTLLDGEIVDFNVMSRRGRLTHAVRRIDPPGEIETQGAATLLFCSSGVLDVESAGGRVRLNRHDAILAETVQRRTWRLFTQQPPSGLFCVEFFAVS